MIWQSRYLFSNYHYLFPAFIPIFLTEQEMFYNFCFILIALLLKGGMFNEYKRVQERCVFNAA